MKTQTPEQTIPIQITNEDKSRLQAMLSELARKSDLQDEYASLISEIERADVIESESISRNIVTMDSTVSVIFSDTSERQQFTLVYPEDADAEHNKISILSPMGSALLGYKVGDNIRWQVPGGIRKFVIAKVEYQPEGDKRKKFMKL